MKYKIKSSITLSLILVLVLTTIKYSNSLNVTAFQKGTLIIIVPCKDGILICSDKRIYRPGVGYNDDFNKIIKLNNSSGFAVTGAPIVWRNKIKIFDVFEIINKYLEKYTITDKNEFWNKLMLEIRNEFFKYVLDAPYKDWPESQYPQKNYILFEVIFFHPDDKWNLKMSLLQFRYIKNINPLVELKLYDLSVKGSFSAFGSGHVIMELQNGNNKDFNLLRDDPKLKKFLKNQTIAKEINLDDAIYFCKKMISASHKMYKLVSAIDGHVGPTYDIFLFSKNGFDYIIN